MTRGEASVPRRPGQPDVRRWPLRGFWRVWLWISAAIGLLLVAGGVLAVAVAWWLPGAGRVVPLLVGLLLCAVGGIIGWQLAHTATLVTLAADGSLVLRRPGGALRTRVERVLRVRPSLLRSDPHTPTVVQTVDGWAYLVRRRPEVDDLVAAIRERNPDLVVDF
jgi:hypothetical protein